MTDQVTIGFKGGRNYIHLTDLFPAMIKAVGAETGHDFIFSVHNVIETQAVTVRSLELGETPDRDIAARLVFNDRQGQQHVAVATAAKAHENLPQRVFDETTIAKHVMIKDQVATYEGDVTRHFSELLVVMNKTLLDALFPQENAKWWAVRLQLNSIPTEWRQVTLTCLTTRPARLYNTAISVDSTQVGEISFVSRPA